MSKYLLLLLAQFSFATIITIKEPLRNNNDISTKIVNKKFEVLLKADKNITGTVCSTLVDYNDNNITPWFKNYFNNQQYSYQTFQKNPKFISKIADKYVQVKSIFIPNQNTSCPNTGNIYYSDTFAIRPYRFEITNFPTIAYAGESFPITFKALDYLDKPTKNYNEIKNVSFKISVYKQKNCFYGELTTVPEFKNGIAKTSAKYSDVGIIGITISENNYEFAKIDKKDTNIQNRLIKPKTIYIKIYPYSFKTNSHFSQSNIYYIDKNLSTQYSHFYTQIEAVNKQNEITKNFDKQCLSEDVNLKFNINNSHHDTFTALYNINGIEVNDTNFTRFSNYWKIPKNIFQKGYSNLDIKFNIKKNYKTPISVVTLDFKNLQANAKYQKESQKEILNKINYFYYLRLFSSDIITDKNITKTPIYILVYDKFHNTKYNQNNQKLLNWFIYDTYYLDDISILGITKNYQYTKHSLKVGAFILKEDKNISLNINNNGYKHFVIHLKTPALLWYSQFKPFNDKLNSYCISHYCIEYKYKKIKKDTKEIEKGVFRGSEIKSHQQTHHIGIKVYR